MNETQVRELLGKGIPKIAATALSGVYPLPFQTVVEPSRDYTVDAQVVASQILYTRSYQVYSFLVMEASQILKLGLRAFPKYGRQDCPKMVISANGEALNTVMAKLAYLVGKVDNNEEAVIAPPIIINCTGPNRIPVCGAEALFLRSTHQDLSMLIIAIVQQV